MCVVRDWICNKAVNDRGPVLSSHTRHDSTYYIYKYIVLYILNACVMRDVREGMVNQVVPDAIARDL